MSILSQIGVVILIVFIILILIRSNKTLEEASKEGEHFVDEWDLRQQRKAARVIEKEQKKHNRTVFLKEEEECEVLEEDFEVPEEEEKPCLRKDNIVFMDDYKNPGITLTEIDENNQVGRRVKVDRIPFTIGRSNENQLVLDDLCVARNHCRIVEWDGQFILEDMGSVNKLFVNGKSEEKVVLRDQLTVYIGNVEFRVELENRRSSRTQLYQNAGEYYYE